MEINAERISEVTVLDLNGRLDAYTSPEVRETVVRLIEDGARNIVVNLTKVDYIDSVGLGTLAGCLRRMAEHGGTICLACGNPQIKRMLDITGVSALCNIFETRKGAVRRNAGRGGVPA